MTNLLAFFLLIVPFFALAASSNVKIVGGEEASHGQFPYMVSIYSKKSNLTHCGGSIYSGEVIITSAQCCLNMGDLSGFQVIAGEFNFDHEDGTEQVRNIDTTRMHPSYNDSTHENDVCLVYLKVPLDTSSNFVEPIELTNIPPETGSSCNVSGWGPLNDGSPSAQVLHWATVKVDELDDCKKAYGTYGITVFQDSMLCASEEGEDFCESDKGGPLVSSKQLVGIASFYTSCAAKLFPGIYANVAHYKEWIESNANQKPSSTSSTSTITTSSVKTSTTVATSETYSTTTLTTSEASQLELCPIFLIVAYIFSLH